VFIEQKQAIPSIFHHQSVGACILYFWNEYFSMESKIYNCTHGAGDDKTKFLFLEQQR
jgi:hypothetical protein